MSAPIIDPATIELRPGTRWVRLLTILRDGTFTVGDMLRLSHQQGVAFKVERNKISQAVRRMCNHGLTQYVHGFGWTATAYGRDAIDRLISAHYAHSATPPALKRLHTLEPPETPKWGGEPKPEPRVVVSFRPTAQPANLTTDVDADRTKPNDLPADHGTLFGVGSPRQAGEHVVEHIHLTLRTRQIVDHEGRGHMGHPKERQGLTLDSRLRDKTLDRDDEIRSLAMLLELDTCRSNGVVTVGDNREEALHCCDTLGSPRAAVSTRDPSRDCKGNQRASKLGPTRELVVGFEPSENIVHGGQAAMRVGS